MFFISYRGLGLLAAVPPVLGMVALAALVEYTFRAAAMGAGATMGLAGVAMAVAGRALHRRGHRDELYAVPLWVWGVVFAACGAGLVGWMGILVSETGWRD